MTDETKEQKHFAWNEGLPTGPDVDLLMKTWPEIKIGDRFEYESIGKLLVVTIGSNRWRSITQVWRRRWLEKGFAIEPETGEAFYVANFDQVAARTYAVMRSVARKVKRQHRRIGTFHSLSEAQSAVREHHGRLLVALAKDARKSSMNLLPKTSVPEVPRISPPKKVVDGD